MFIYHSQDIPVKKKISIMIAKPGEPPVEKNNPLQTVWDPPDSRNHRLTEELLLRGVGVWNSDPGGVPPFRFEGWTNLLGSSYAHPKKTATWLDRNKQTNMTQVVDVLPMKQQLVSWTMDLPLSEIPKRIYLSGYRVHQTWPLVGFAAHDHWSINGKHGKFIWSRHMVNYW